ncbi:hypothetical protein GF420_05550 [candidate division GN15 bacterium]|nr:hypothetical protein [candidate division GN15 bacterium]
MAITLYPRSSIMGTLINIKRNHRAVYAAMEKLSSGLRINRASDDPAGLVISEQLRTQIASLSQEIENVTAGIYKYNSVSSEVLTLREQLTDLRANAVGAANEAVNSDTAQQAYQIAAENIVATFNETIANAEYNGSKTLDGSAGSLANISELTGIDLSTAEGAAAAIETIDAKIREVDSVLVELGAEQKNDLESRLASLEISKQNLISAESQIRDTSYGDFISAYVGSMIREKASIALLAHSRVQSESILSLFRGIGR